MKSKITGGETELLFHAKILNKYNIAYYRCKETGFIQTEEPFWLKEAYSSAIASLDIGLLIRNNTLCKECERIISTCFAPEERFLDFAGGYGIFTRLMRDKGFNFFHVDKYCENIFAKFFELSDTNPAHSFELITAFEVFEHLSNPQEEIAEMFNFSDSVLFSTELIPNTLISTSEDWWYFVPEIGQHISFYTKKSLLYLASLLNCQLYSNDSNLHLLTKKSLKTNPFESPKPDKFLLRKLKKIVKSLEQTELHPRESLLDHDWQLIRRILNTRSSI